MESKLNTIVLLFDQQQSYHLLPNGIVEKLPGYQAFKKIGVEFTNMQCNRNDCSQARAVLVSGRINTGIQDVTNCCAQYNSIPYLNETFDTNGKVFKRNGYKTAFYGKQHFDSRLDSQTFTTPSFSQNTSGSMKVYGYDIFNTWGESDFYPNGMLMDCFYLENILPPYSEIYDYIDKTNGNKLQGLLPYLRARVEDKNPFMIEYHLINPHDIESCVINLNTVFNGGVNLSQPMFQFFFPFMNEQVNEYSTPNPYVYNQAFRDAYIQHQNLATNYFEKTYEQYKSDPSSIPNFESLIFDYALDSDTNSITPFNAAFNQYWWYLFNTCANKNDFGIWKNMINTYYGLVIEADSYVYKLYKELEKLDLLKNTNVIITSDHGEMLGTHGLRSKGQLFKESQNIPCLIYSPKISVELHNTKSDFLCSQIDIIPTLIDLNNLTNTKDEFIGTSLFNNYVPKTNYDGRSTLYVLNGNAFLTMYYSYLLWYKNLDDETKSKIYKSPSNLFEFQYCFSMVTTIYENQLYKFGRFYSLFDLMNYNFIDTLISKNVIINICDSVSNITGLTELYSTIKSFLIINLPDNSNFNEGLNAIINVTGNNDNIYIYGYVCFAIQHLISLKPYDIYPYTGLLAIPGSNTSYDEIVKNGDLTFFCYNLSNDPNELINLADPKNIKDSYHSLFNELNNRLNLITNEQKCKDFITILPFVYINSTVTSLINSVYNNLIDNLNLDLVQKLSYIFLQQSNEEFAYKIPKLYASSRSNQFYNLTTQPNTYPGTGDYKSSTITESTAVFKSPNFSSSSTSSSTATSSGNNITTTLINSATTSQIYAMNNALNNLKTENDGTISITNIVKSNLNS
jgi:arylsulfatase A-like enzyme